MPVGDPNAGYIAIWLVSCILFFSIAFGGGCLIMYMILPESETSAWLPIVGVTLVCLPWFFWLITCLYRIFSRLCGFRMAIGLGRDGGGGVTMAGRGDGGCSVGGASHANGLSSTRRDGASNNGTAKTDSSSSVRKADSNDSNQERKINNSLTSDESELPLKSSLPS